MARIGTFSERVVCPAEMLVPIRHEMPWPQAALVGCCVPTGVGAVTRCAEVEAGASVLVIGCGGVGLNVVQGARLAGAGIDRRRRPARQQADLRQGVRRDPHVQRLARRTSVDRVRELTAGRGVDYAFDAIGGEATTLQILDAIRPGGTAVIVGMAAMNVRAPIAPYFMALQEKAIKGTMYGSVRPEHRLPEARRSLPRRPAQDRRAGEPDLQARRDQRGLRGDAQRPGRARRRRLQLSGGPTGASPPRAP